MGAILTRHRDRVTPPPPPPPPPRVITTPPAPRQRSGDAATIRTIPRPDGYDLVVAQQGAIKVRQLRDGWTVTNGGNTSRIISKPEAVAMADRVARLLAAP